MWVWILAFCRGSSSEEHGLAGPAFLTNLLAFLYMWVWVLPFCRGSGPWGLSCGKDGGSVGVAWCPSVQPDYLLVHLTLLGQECQLEAEMRKRPLWVLASRSLESFGPREMQQAPVADWINLHGHSNGQDAAKRCLKHRGGGVVEIPWFRTMVARLRPIERTRCGASLWDASQSKPDSFAVGTGLFSSRCKTEFTHQQVIEQGESAKHCRNCPSDGRWAPWIQISNAYHHFDFEFFLLFFHVFHVFSCFSWYVEFIFITGFASLQIGSLRVDFWWCKLI